MVYVPYGAQNNPSGGLIAYEINRKPYARRDLNLIYDKNPIIINALANDGDPNGDILQFIRIAGKDINLNDGSADVVSLKFGTVEVFNPGDDPTHPYAAYLKFTPNTKFQRLAKITYQIADMAPNRTVNGVELNEPEPTHTPRRAKAKIWLLNAKAFITGN